MNFHHSAILLSLGLGTLALVSCSAEDPGDGTNNSTSGGCDTTFAAAATAAPVSLRTDLMPIFGLSCTASQCHNEEDHKADLFLGVRCAFDAAAKWKCTFPATATQTAQPLTEDVVNRVYTSLTAMSKTAPAVARVVPGNPGGSFLMDKLIDAQNDKGYVCEKQDNRAIGVCGDYMPLNSSFCAKSSETGPSKVAAFAAWVAQGAQNN